MALVILFLKEKMGWGHISLNVSIFFGIGDFVSQRKNGKEYISLNV